jgi:hypothetical protein
MKKTPSTRIQYTTAGVVRQNVSSLTRRFVRLWLHMIIRLANWLASQRYRFLLRLHIAERDTIVYASPAIATGQSSDRRLIFAS